MGDLYLFAREFGYTPDEYRAMSMADQQLLIREMQEHARRVRFQAKAEEHLRRGR